MTTAAQLAALTERFSNHVENMEKAMAEERAERILAAKERAAILAQMNDLQRDMQQVKPVTDMVSSLHARVAGGMIVLGFVGAVAWGAILFFKENILKFIGAE